MAICQFFLQGRCRFGDRCWNEHPRGGGGRPHSAGPVRGAGGGWGAATQRYANVIQPPTFKHGTWGGSSDGGGFSGASGFGSQGDKSTVFSQNRFSALSSANSGDGFSDEEQRLFDCIAKDMASWESSRQWMFSCYSPMKDKPNVSGFQDFSPEEVRLEYYKCSANSNTENYINSVNQLVQQWRNRLQELKALNASGKASLLSQLKNAVSQPLPSLGFGGQQASSFGFPSFPVSSSSSSSAASFSFKANPSVPSGNAPAFGSSAAASNPPTFGVKSSHSAPTPIGFGNSSAPSAASFSFKTSGTTSGSGTSGLSGFGNSAAANSSSTAPLTVSGTPNAATGTSQSGASNTSAAQAASASGHNVTATPSAVLNGITSDKLYTPRSELTAEELEQFEAKRFTLGKIPLKPPPVDLINL
ncbi:nucleoporin NUP42 [Tympanuchus pallidicinctus]|uniref:nucleoporin NUP42 n=1 Tax=Tympanuchus pallidicinctus TaxID=109042 RepID=UPI0022873138|nr:nucleoporin NUP42 [Tympanuchus pallidicinctus]